MILSSTAYNVCVIAIYSSLRCLGVWLYICCLCFYCKLYALKSFRIRHKIASFENVFIADLKWTKYRCKTTHIQANGTAILLKNILRLHHTSAFQFSFVLLSSLLYDYANTTQKERDGHKMSILLVMHVRRLSLFFV